MSSRAALKIVSPPKENYLSPPALELIDTLELEKSLLQQAETQNSAGSLRLLPSRRTMRKTEPEPGLASLGDVDDNLATAAVSPEIASETAYLRRAELEQAGRQSALARKQNSERPAADYAANAPAMGAASQLNQEITRSASSGQTEYNRLHSPRVALRETLLEYLPNPKLILALIVVIGLIALGITWQQQQSLAQVTQSNQKLNQQKTAGSGSGKTGDNGNSESALGGGNSGEVIYVHIVGQVQKPGLVKLRANAHLEEAIKAAGGIKEPADLPGINLARVLNNGEKVVIPAPGQNDVAQMMLDRSRGESLPAGTDSGNALSETGGEASKTGNGMGSGAGSGGRLGKIRINQANAQELEKIPGVGPSLAGRIVQYRSSNGGFNRLEDLRNVKGIGEKTYQKLLPYIAL